MRADRWVKLCVSAENRGSLSTVLAPCVWGKRTYGAIYGPLIGWVWPRVSGESPIRGPSGRQSGGAVLRARGEQRSWRKECPERGWQPRAGGESLTSDTS